MKLALAQYSMSNDAECNFRKAADHMAVARRSEAELVAFPELCLSPFFPQYAGGDASRYAMTLKHELVQALRDNCVALSLSALPNIYLQDEGNCFDASLLINRLGKIEGVSKMVHIGQLPYFYEQDYYAPSDTGFRVYDLNGIKVGVVICFDRHFPESIRTCVLQGADVILVPTANIATDPRALYEWEMRVAAMQNGVYIAMCNRVGQEGAVRFYGESIIVDPFGEVLRIAGQDEELVVAEIDLRRVAAARLARPYLELRVPRSYR